MNKQRTLYFFLWVCTGTSGYMWHYEAEGLLRYMADRVNGNTETRIEYVGNITTMNTQDFIRDSELVEAEADRIAAILCNTN